MTFLGDVRGDFSPLNLRDYRKVRKERLYEEDIYIPFELVAQALELNEDVSFGSVKFLPQ